jgi:hypothetical protein
MSMSALGWKITLQSGRANVRRLIDTPAKRTGIRDAGVIQIDPTTSNLTQRNDEKSETLTGPNPRLLLI